MKKSRTTSLTGLVAVFILTLFLLIPLAAQAQDRAWVQIEAQPTRAEALERARAYASAFPDVQGYALRSGWYGILLGPYNRTEAAARLADLKQERLIPSDSFISFERNFRDPFWPPAGTEPAPQDPASPEATAPEATENVIPVDPLPEPEALAALTPDPTPAETPAEARASEAALDLAARQEVQTALQWFGFYDAAIDGAFGPGTRAAMTAWQ